MFFTKKRLILSTPIFRDFQDHHLTIGTDTYKQLLTKMYPDQIESALSTRMQLTATIHPSPCAEQCKRDVSMVMPTRRPSISSLPSLVKPLSKYLSSSSPALRFSSCPQRSIQDSSMGSSNSFHVSSNELSFSLLATTIVFETPEDEEEERSVRFAPSPTTMTTAVMCLADYTPEEVEACWYSHADIQYMRGKRKRKQARKIFKKKSKRLQRKVLKREDTRWNT